MSAITALRFAVVKTSAIGLCPGFGCDSEAALGLFGFVSQHAVVKSCPLSIASIQFVISEFPCIRPTPSLGGKTFQNARPSAPGIFIAIGMQTGKGVGDCAPHAKKVRFGKLFKTGRKATSELKSGGAQRVGNGEARDHGRVRYQVAALLPGKILSPSRASIARLDHIKLTIDGAQVR